MRKLLLYFFCLIIANSFAQERPFKIENIKQTIKVDGKLDEAIWKDIKAFHNFHNHFPNDSGKVKKQTIVKFFHDGESMHFAVTIFDDTPKYIVQSLKRDEGYDSFIKGDGFGIIIDATGQQNSGYLFAVNVKGAQTDGIVSIVDNNYAVDASWNAKWQSQTLINDTTRYYEISIPFNAIAYDPKNDKWKINFASIDAKTPQHTTLTAFSRNYNLMDLRFTQEIEIESLPNRKTSKLTLIPSTVFSYTEDIANQQRDKQVNIGLEAKYNITSSLKLNATFNPDFSQIEQDDQITNLTRFDISFPERRNFFLENGDLFNNLGSRGVNLFYSRRIGAETKMLFGLKLSGKISKNTRIGVLNTQTEASDELSAQNYTVLVGRQNLSSSLTATGYLVNRQETKKVELGDSYNRIAGLNFNYIANNNKWLGQFNYGKSLSPSFDKNNNFYHTTISYSTRKWQWTSNINRVEENFITDVGFVPRLYNFDASLKQTTRDGYWENYTEIIYNQYQPISSKADRNEYKLRSNSFYSTNFKLIEEELFFIFIRRFKNLSYFFSTANYNYNNLQYPTDVLNNDNPLPADIYNTSYIIAGYISPTNKKVSIQNRLQYGSFYNGDRFHWDFTMNYRLQPWAKLGFNYNFDIIDLNEYGSDTIHTLNFSGNIFFNKQLSWSTIVQLSTQMDDFNINSRLQWEFKPLSYIYLVVSDNYNTEDFNRKDYGIAIKLNYSLDL